MEDTRIIFWDIETFSARGFPDASRPSDFVFMISSFDTAETLPRLYTTCPVDADPAFQLLSFEKFDGEVAMLTAFYDWVCRSGADVLVGYNSDSFDVPYFLRRCPGVSSQDRSFPNGTSGRRSAPSFCFESGKPEVLDLIHYFRRYGPRLPNYKLDTVARHFLGRGKVDCPVEEMMQAVSLRDEARLKLVARYSVEDTVLLRDLWRAANLAQRLPEIAGQLGSTVRKILTEPIPELVSGKESRQKNPKVKRALGHPGLYQGVTVFDASASFTEPRFAGLPAEFHVEAWYQNQKEMPAALSAAIAKAGPDFCFATSKPPLLALRGAPADFPWLDMPVVERYATLASGGVAPSGSPRYAAVEGNGSATFSGRGPGFWSPPFYLAREAARRHMLGLGALCESEVNQAPREHLLIQRAGRRDRVLVTRYGDRSQDYLAACDRPLFSFYAAEMGKLVDALSRLPK